VPYFIFNLFFGLLTLFLAQHGISLGEKINWFNFFVTPFVTGHQYFLFLAAWFVPQLFIVHLLAQWLLIRDRRHYFSFALLFISLAASLVFSFGFKSIPAAWTLLAARTVLALAFYLLGQALNILEPKLRPILIYPASFAVLYIIYVSLETFFGGFTYFFAFLQFLNGPVVTILGTLTAILMIYIISYYLAQTLPAKNFLYQIGQHTFSVMALHLLVFWLINYFLYRLAFVARSSLSNVFFQYQPDHYWFVYVGLGVTLPVLAALGYEKLKIKYRPVEKTL
jgi:fucose 4-O-acetylase-like acetyltransferase